MELRLLGPLEVHVDGAPQQVGGRGERALLALLALAAGHVVATTTLIDALWEGTGLPEDPGNALQLRVSKLRRALAGVGAADRVRREGPGYRLEADRDDVDVHRFERLIDSARRTGDAPSAVECYRAALDLWRGEPLVDFAGEPWATAHSARLQELRYAAMAERAERLLSLGQYDEVVAGLESVVAEAPTRERLVAQLMTALFNAGRQADALEVFGRTRAVLAGELGIDPSRELRAVMEQILRQDPAITPAPSVPRVALAAPRATAPAVGNLPLRTTSFVGRDDELRRTQDLLGSSRLVTLVGPGGSGKTALAVEAARVAASDYRDGAVLVRFAAVTEREALAHVVADALGISIEGGTAAHRPRDVLTGHLRSKQVLLVMDNCEHLVEPVASLVEAVLSRCTDVRILATSREALAVPGEVQLPLSPLQVPAPDTPPAAVTDFPAAQLFLDRARAVVPDLVVDEQVLVAVASICRRLDGIPLALELAAARLASLSVSDLAERVRDRFAVLTSGSRTADARQRTLRGAVDWSHDLLTEAEQRLLRRLAVFRGGWTVEAAEAVVVDDQLPRADVLDLLDRLVRQSMVVADRSVGTRFRMLETLRQYAGDRLDAAGERGALAAAHAAHFVSLGERAETGLRGATQAQWVDLLREEHANIRAALAWLIDTGTDPDAALRLAGSLGLYWHLGRHIEGREVLRRVMAMPGGSPQARARAMQAVALVERPRACIVHPSEQCAAAARNSLEIFDAAGDVARAAFSRLLLAVEGVSVSASVDAETLLEEAEQTFAELGDTWGLAVAAFIRMETATRRGLQDEAAQAAATAIALFRALDDGWGLSAVLYHRGGALAQFGRNDEAVVVLEEAIQVADRAGVHNTVQWATADLGLTLLALGRVDEATRCFSRTATAPDEVGDDAGSILAAYGSAVVARRNGDFASARPLFQAAFDGFQGLGVSLATGLALAGLGESDEAVGKLTGARASYTMLIRLGERTGEAGLTASGLEGLARVALAEGDPEESAQLLGHAGWIRTTYDHPPTPAEQSAVDTARRAVVARLGQSAYEEGVRRGARAGEVMS